MNLNMSGGFVLGYFMSSGDEPVKVSVLAMQSTWLQYILKRDGLN